MDISFNSEKTPPKRAKRSPIQRLKAGETMIDIKLVLIVADSVRVVGEKTKVWTIVGSDGDDYINITMWDKNLERLSREIESSFQEKTYSLKTWAVFKVAEPFNYGSVEFELRAQEGSTITIVTETDSIIKGVTKELYFDFLGSKLALNETEFMPSKIANLRKGEKFIEIEAEVMKVQSVREVMVKGAEANVIDVWILDGKTKARVSAWNILALFLEYFLKGKQGCGIKLHNVIFKEDSHRGEVNFVFTNSSRISIVEKMEETEIAKSLMDLSKKRGLVSCAVRVQIARKQTVLNLASKQDGTLCVDNEHKAQLIFPNSIRFDQKEEITLQNVNVDCNDAGVLTLTIYDNWAYKTHTDKTIQTNLNEVDYPQNK